MALESKTVSNTPPLLPDIPVLAVSLRAACVLTRDGELQTLTPQKARLVLHKQAVLVCHAPFTRGRLGLEEFTAFDVLELFTFIHPAKSCVPTIAGLCAALGLPVPESGEDQAMALMDIARALLEDIRNDPLKAKADPLAIAGAMGMQRALQGGGWPWTPYIFAALGEEYEESIPVNARGAMNIWKHLPEWAEEAPEPPHSHHGVTGEEARERLKHLLGPEAEKRDEQIEYTNTITAAFSPIECEDNPPVVLAEAGTGVGKTLGYLAPASLWAEKNQGAVWVSTYTKNLQRQIESELDRLYPDPALKEAHVAVRKGRENYLCLLNLEDTTAAATTAHHYSSAVAAGIMARWAAATKDGDLTGVDFPGWLAGLLGYGKTLALADRRGECLYSACDHYRKCFVERSVRKAKHARIVVANHALVLIQSALAGVEEDLPSRYVFDEGHHLFHAADSAFSAHLTGREARDLRRWILGAEGGKRTRARGLKKRADDLCAGDAEAEKLLGEITHRARVLNDDGWTRRLKDGQPLGPCETFLHGIYQQVWARGAGREGPYSMETEVHPLEDSLIQKAAELQSALSALEKPMAKLAALFRKRLAEDNGMLDSDTRKRLDSVAASLERRAVLTLAAWVGMLQNLREGVTNDTFVDWLEIERVDGRAVDVGLYRHHIDPMQPFAKALKPHMQGMAVTSATLRDSALDEEESWLGVRERTGAATLTHQIYQSSFDSPFAYDKQTKVFIINDVRKDDLAQVSGAYRALFQASGGGALGLFTAISRLRAVQNKIAAPLEDAGLHLYAQHVDEADAGTLVDMFREDTHACLLGTDAVRDGVDVPGDSLRLIVFDRVPWPRPNILHKARREAFGKKRYDEMQTRLKIKQAFGRLIRRAGDKGVFVMLDPMFPSRLHTAFPRDVEIQKIGLSDAAVQIKEFLK